MAKALVVVESPAKAKTINKYLGRNYKVIASMGHVRDLPKSKLGVDIREDFEPSYEVIASVRRFSKSSRTPRRSPTTSTSRLTRTAKEKRSAGIWRRSLA